MDVLCNLCRYMKFRKMIIVLVLATDLSQHVHIIRRTRDYFQLKDLDNAKPVGDATNLNNPSAATKESKSVSRLLGGLGLSNFSTLGAIFEDNEDEDDTKTVQPYHDALLDEMDEATRLMLYVTEIPLKCDHLWIFCTLFGTVLFLCRYKLFLKCADVSHPARPTEHHLRRDNTHTHTHTHTT